jgi:2-haloacid dehalogenase
MRYRYLTFDCYGTLIDWRTGIERELASALGEVSLGGQDLLNAYLDAERREESGYKKYREVLRDSVLSMSYALGKDVDADSASKFAASVPRWPAFPDSARFLREMGSRGYKRYILSNVDNDLLAATIRNSDLEVDGFVTAEEVGSYKPKPGHWVEFLKRTGAEKDIVLHVAQSIYHDIIPMQQFGIATAWVNRYAEPFPPEASPSIVTDSLEGLSRALD